MPMSEAHIRASRKYNEKAYDRIELKVPKGKKADLQAHAATRKESLNALVNRAIDSQILRDNANDMPVPIQSNDTPTQPQPVQSKKEPPPPILDEVEQPTGTPKFNAKTLLIELERGYEIDKEGTNIPGAMMAHSQSSGARMTETQRELSFDGLKLMKLWQKGIEDEHVTLDWLMDYVVGQ